LLCKQFYNENYLADSTVARAHWFMEDMLDTKQLS